MKCRFKQRTMAALAAVGILVTAVACGGRQAVAQDWPNRFVKVISVGGSGGTADILSRIVAEHLSSALKQNFIVENRAGVGGTLGSQVIASSTPDGYTIGVTLLSSLALATAINPSVQYDPVRDFTHIGYIAGAPVVLSANPKTNVKSLPEFVRYAQTNRFTYATAGLGSDGHLAGELIAENLKVKTEHVPYKSTGQGLSDVVAGHVPFSTLNIGSSSSFVRSGQLNAVAVTSRERLPDYPELPSFTELGYPAVAMTTWYLLSGPPNMPAQVVNKLNETLRKFIASPETQQRFRRDGLLTESMSPAELGAFVASENVRWKPLIDSVRSRL